MVVVNFPDAAFEAVIRAILGIPVADITDTDCLGVTAIGLAGAGQYKGIQDITGIEYCTNCVWIDLAHNNIQDISMLDSILTGAGVAFLDLSYNIIDDVTALANFVGGVLWPVLFSHNRIADISPLETTQIKMLSLTDNYIVDIKPFVDNAYYAAATGILLSGNPLNSVSYDTYIPILVARSVSMTYDTGYTPPSDSDPVGAMYGGDFEGFLTVLNDDYIVQVLEITDTVTNIFQTLLDYCWAHTDETLLLGAVDAALDLTLSMTFSNKSIMKCFQQVLQVVGGYLSCRHDPNNPALRYIYLEVLKVNSGKEVRLGKNLKSIDVSADMSQLCTRIAPFGDGTGIDQLNLSMMSPVAETATQLTPDGSFWYLKLGTAAARTEYRCYKDWTGDGDALPAHVIVYKNGGVDTPNWLQGSDPRMLKSTVGDISATYTVSYQHDYYMIGDTAYEGSAYGRITLPYAVKAATDVNALAEAARVRLAVLENPLVAYKASAIDLSQLTGREWENYDIGDEINTIVESLGVDVDVSVEGKKQNLLSPEDIDYTFANFPLNLSDQMADQSRRLQALEEEPLQGNSETVMITEALIMGPFIADVKNFQFTIEDIYIRCNAVSFSFSETDDTGVIYPSAAVDVKVEVDGTTIDPHCMSMSGEDITSYLTTPILGTQHLIKFTNVNGSSTVLHVGILAQVYRRSVALF